MSRPVRTFPYFREGISVLLCVLACLAASCTGPDRDVPGILVITALKGRVLDGGPRSIEALHAWAGAPGQGRVIRAAAGNTLHGSAESLVTRGSMVVEALSAFGLDVLMLDARDFTFGQDRGAELARTANFPFASANLIPDPAQGRDWYRTAWADPASGTVLLGLAGPWFLQKAHPEHVRGMGVRPPMESVSDRIRDLPEGPGLVGVLAPSWRIQPDGSGRLWDTALLSGVDFVVQECMDPAMAGTETRRRPDGSVTAIIAVPQDDSPDWPGAIMVRGLHGKGVEVEWLPPEPAAPSDNGAFRDWLRSARSRARMLLDQEVTRMESLLDHQDQGESPAGDLVCDLMRIHGGTDIAFLNSGFLRGGLPAGPVSLQDLYDFLPFGGSLAEAAISGRDLLGLLDHSLGFLADSDRGRGFLQVSGLNLRWRRGPDGAPIPLEPRDVVINGRPLDPDTLYTLATELFLLSGGDGYQGMEHVRNSRISGNSLVDEVREWLAARPSWTPPAPGRIREVAVP